MSEHDPNALQAVMVAAAADVPLSFRPMFGGILAYVDGRPIASLSNRGIALKLGPADRDALLREPGARPLQYEPGDPPSKTYVVVPDAMHATPEVLRAWIDASAKFVLASGEPRRRANRR